MACGCQKRAVFKALTKPMCGMEILEKAKIEAPRIQLRDVRLIMRHSQERQITFCLNPHVRNGKLSYFTKKGCRCMRDVFQIAPAPIQKEMDWDLYSWVVRASVRKAIVMELGKQNTQSHQRWTASNLRRVISKSYPIGLNPTIDGLAELEHNGVVECIGITKKRNQRCFGLSKNGIQIHAHFNDHNLGLSEQSD